MDQHYLTPLFEPRSLVLFTGPQDQPAAQTPQARALLAHMQAQAFKGAITPLDVRVAGTLDDCVKTRADLALVALPEDEIIAALELAGRAGVKAALVLGENIGASRAQAMHRVAQRCGYWLLGPNSHGLQRPLLRLNAGTFGALAAPGPLALVTQSGALMASILDWAQQNLVGFSTVVTLGPRTQVDLAAVLDYLAADHQTHGVVVCMEDIADDITDARRFTSALRAAASAKPVMVLKPGCRRAGDAVAPTRTGVAVSRDDVFETVLRRAGAAQVRTLGDLFSAVRGLASHYRPQGLAQAQIPDFRASVAAAGMSGNLAAFHQNQQLLRQTPPPLSPLTPPDVAGARRIIENARAGRRETLTASEVKALLAAFHIPAAPLPPHGREAYIGIRTDESFGPVIVFGAGGALIERVGDYAMALPPLNPFLAQRLIDRARARDLQGAWRAAPPADGAALGRVLLRVSEMACELPQLREMDIHSLTIDERGAVAVDARIRIGPAVQAAPGRADRYRHLSILPYPAQWQQVCTLRNGGQYTLRPIRPDDAQRLQGFTRQLSPESRYFRFVSSMAELPPAMLARFTLIDYDREMALCAVVETGPARAGGSRARREKFAGVSRYITNPDLTSCEFSLAVADDYAGQGLGTQLTRSIMDVARSRGLKTIKGMVLASNGGMLRLLKRLGFDISACAEEPDFRRVTHVL